MTLLLINLHASKSYQVKLRTPQPLSSVDVYVVSSDALSSQAIVSIPTRCYTYSLLYLLLPSARRPSR